MSKLLEVLLPMWCIVALDEFCDGLGVSRGTGLRFLVIKGLNIVKANKAQVAEE